MKDLLENTYQIKPRPDVPGTTGWFNCYKNGEWIDAFPSGKEAQTAVDQWRNESMQQPIDESRTVQKYHCMPRMGKVFGIYTKDSINSCNPSQFDCVDEESAESAVKLLNRE